ncbi:MAG TPA: N-acetylmuramic acid 6-phosphate etherase [Gemmatimonadaceae bacterium]|nr:N-acetylmuramic acid 6-phosphate etherase [Gemmatimonadaceae bacterium]
MASSKKTAALDPRVTEQRNPRTADIDLASPLEIVDLIAAEDRAIPEAVHGQREPIARAMEAAERAFRAGRRLIYVGAGTSGRLGVLDASEMPPTYGTDPEMVQGIIAGGYAALLRSQEGAEDTVENAVKDLEERKVGAGDFVVGIAASGTTPYVRRALEHARSVGATTAIVACSPPPQATLDAADIAIVAITGPEVVTGSTRMKAGTATKLILNMITTGAMIRMGKTFGNLMVDLRATNAKLRDRSSRIVMEVCDVDRDEARALIERAGGVVKTAIVMHYRKLPREAAERELTAAGGVIRKVIGRTPPPVPQ